MAETRQWFPRAFLLTLIEISFYKHFPLDTAIFPSSSLLLSTKQRKFKYSKEIVKQNRKKCMKKKCVASDKNPFEMNAFECSR